VFQSKEARPIIDYGAEVPEHSTSSWIATDKIIKDRPAALQKALNAIYGGVAFLQDDKNRDPSVKIVAEIDEIADPIAAAELDGNLKKLSPTGAFTKEWMVRALDMARMIGMTDPRTGRPDVYRDLQAGPDQSVSQIQIVSARLALLAAVMAAWALLPKYGFLDPRLLPPLGDVLAMLGKQLSRRSSRKRSASPRSSHRGLRDRGALGAAIGCWRRRTIISARSSSRCCSMSSACRNRSSCRCSS